MVITAVYLDEMYGKYLEEDNRTASEKIKDSYSDLWKCFDDYISAISEEYFKNGFRYALEQTKKNAPECGNTEGQKQA